MVKDVDYKKNPSGHFEDVDKMNKKKARREADALREAIDYHDYRYHVKSQPEISDARYDALFDRLEKIEAAFPETRSDESPTRRVGAKPVSELRKVSHAAPMLSLNASLEKEKIKGLHDFILRHLNGRHAAFVMEPKFDGLSVELVYEKGDLKVGATRGDGEVGEDITHNLKTIPAVPLHLRQDAGPPDFLSVRGEVFMPTPGFKKLNRKRTENGQEPFANPRNAASGIMRQLDPGNVADKPLSIRFYDILQMDPRQPDSHWDILKQFSRWGLKTSSHNKKCTDFIEIRKYYEKLSREREALEYEIDGMVIKLDSHEQREALGTRQRSPRWAFAWKFEPRKEVTTLEEIVVQVGRTGMLTPVALLAPVDVGGVTVSRATLHNADDVKKKDLRPGDRVRIARAGDVIPEVVERMAVPGKKRKPPFSMPEQCPACGARIYREGAYYFCPGRLKCRPQVSGGIAHYASREAMNINGLGGKTAERLIEEGLVKDISDLYRLQTEDLLRLEGFAEKSARQLHQAIQAARHPPLDRFLYALGIRHLGQHGARLLAQHVGSLESVRQAGRQDLANIAEIGSQIAESVTHFFQQRDNKKVIERLLRMGVDVQGTDRTDISRSFEGKTFVFTGKLDEMTRQEAEDLVERMGGRATSSVSGETDYVVVGQAPGKKYEAAKKKRIETIDEESFKKLISHGR